MVYKKSSLNEAGVWFIVASSVLAGPLLILNESSTYGKFVGIILTSGGIFLVFYLLFHSVQQITTFDDRLELSYYLRKITIPYTSIKNVRLVQQQQSSKGITRSIDVIEIVIFPDKKIYLGGNFGGFLKHSTKKLYSEIINGKQRNA